MENKKIKFDALDSELFYQIFENIPVTVIGFKEDPFFLLEEFLFILGLKKADVDPIYVREIDDKNYINQRGLYSLVMKSNKQSCLDFQRHVYSTHFPLVETLFNKNIEGEIQNPFLEDKNKILTKNTFKEYKASLIRSKSKNKRKGSSRMKIISPRAKLDLNTLLESLKL